MGERKVLNKYYPPDFDPSKIPKRIPLKNKQMTVRMMLPMSIRCNTCGTYMYKGTKFNCRKEDVVGDTYLGLMKFRFYFKCTKCSAEMVMKTDPQNSDYEMESGASRNFEPWRAADEQKDAAKRKREQEELGDAMRALENRTLDSKMEMDILAALDEMKSMRARQATLDPAAVLEVLQRTAGRAGGSGGGASADPLQLTEADEELIKKIVFRKSEKFVKRIESDDEDDDGGEAVGKGGQEEAKRARMGTANGGEAEQRDDTGARTVRSTDSASGSASAAAGIVQVEHESTSLSEAEPAAAPGSNTGGAVVAKGASLKPGNVFGKFAPEEPRPAFEMKPVKVAFMVKAKSKVTRGPTADNGGGSGAGIGADGLQSGGGRSQQKHEPGLEPAGAGAAGAGAVRRTEEKSLASEGPAGTREPLSEEKGKAVLTDLFSAYGSDGSEED